MAAPLPHEITGLLRSWAEGDQAALDQLMPLIYAELRRIARRYMARENPAHTLQTTALINEAYLRLVDQRSVRWHNRAHFFAIAAQMMRRILVDYARSRHRLRRGGAGRRVALEEALTVSDERGAELVALDEALTALAAINPRKGQVVELRFFGGLSEKETAEVLQVSEQTVMRDWRAAKLWLLRELSRGAGDES